MFEEADRIRSDNIINIVKSCDVSVLQLHCIDVNILRQIFEF